MPVIDLVCTACSAVDSTFLPASLVGHDHPEAEVGTCSKCGSKSERNYSGSSASVGFMVPPVVHYNKSTGQYSIPGNRDDACDHGYERVEMRDMRMYSKISGRINAMETEKAQYLQEAEKQFFDARLKEQREARKVQVEQAVAKGGYWAEWKDDHGHLHREWRPVTRRALGLLDASQKYVNASIEARRRKVSRGGPNFHSRIIEHSASERSVVDGAGKKATFFFTKK